MDNERDAPEFLGRLDIRAEDVESKTKFANRLDDIFQENRIAFATKKQVEALFPIAEQKFLDAPQAGVKRISFLRNGKPQERFTIPGNRGLFNFQSVLKFLGSGK